MQSCSRGTKAQWEITVLVINELFWEQLLRWRALVEEHVDAVFDICHAFFDTLLQELCTADVRTRFSSL